MGAAPLKPARQSRASNYMAGPDQRAALEQDRLDTALDGWETWSVSCLSGRATWSAMPEGARIAVFSGAESAFELIGMVRRYTAALPQRIAEVRAEIAALPDNGIGRDRKAVLSALVEALEKLRED